MEEILHQLRLVAYPIIYMGVFNDPGCAGFRNHQPYQLLPVVASGFQIKSEINGTKRDFGLEGWISFV